MNVVNEYEVEIDVVVHVPVRKRVVIPASLDDGTLLIQESPGSSNVRILGAGMDYIQQMAEDEYEDWMQEDDWSELMSEVVHIDTEIIERVPF